MSMGSSSGDSKEGGAKHGGGLHMFCLAEPGTSSVIGLSDRLLLALGQASPSHLIFEGLREP